MKTSKLLETECSGRDILPPSGNGDVSQPEDVIKRDMPPFSILDLAPITLGSNAGQAFRNSLDLAQHAERWGYHRYWLAEHHNMPAVASAATSVVIGHVAAGTSTIRVGAGGIMLPNHSPLVIAEQFGTLASLFPKRIDLGLGRAPGSDQITALALRRSLSVDTFPQDVQELIAFFREPAPGQRVKAVPGAGLHVPIWILGSSLFGATLAAELGLPFAFASHFAPAQMMSAIEIYRTRFQPTSIQEDGLERSHLMLGVNIVAADTDDEARRLFTSHQQIFLALRRGTLGPVPPPLDPDEFDASLTPLERAELQHVLGSAIVGSAVSVRRGLTEFIERTGADEIIVASQVFDHAARLRSYEIVADIAGAWDSGLGISAEAQIV
jgi:luciferase family oxidoreductase group 1